MEFKMYLHRQEIDKDKVQVLLRENEYIKALQVKKYDTEFDDETSMIFDICTIFEESKIIKFVVIGFGDKPWPVDCKFDLPSMIEGIHYYISNKISNNRYEYQLRFDEQGVQRYIDITSEGDKLALTCHSYTKWKGNPDVIKMQKSEFKAMIINLYNDFISYAHEICPILINHEMLSEWKML